MGPLNKLIEGDADESISKAVHESSIGHHHS